VIAGGGLTGCATAYAFAAAGVKVMLVEAEQIGRGNTGASTGSIADDPGIALSDLENVIGKRDAVRAWKAWRRAALDFAGLLRRLNVKCDLQPQSIVTVATTPEQAMRLARDRKARLDAGLDAPLLSARAIKGEVALEAAAGIRGK